MRARVSFVMLLFVQSCGVQRSPERAPTEESLAYAIAGSAAHLEIDVRLPAGSVLDGSARVRDLSVDGRPAALGDACAAACLVHYRVALDDALHGESATTTITELLVTPRGHGGMVEIESRLPFAAAVAKTGERIRARARDLDVPCVVGAFTHAELTASGAIVELALTHEPRASTDAAITRWIERSLRSVAQYYQRAPFPRALFIVEASHRDEIFGMTDHRGVGSVALQFGPTSTVDGDDDWVATHELFHLAFPVVGRKHRWVSEGIATYVEPVARVRAGDLDERTMWRDFARGLPKGEQLAGEGLEITHTWASTYWGGALFFFAADVELRVRSKGRYGLEHVMRALGPGQADLDEVLRRGDHATENTVLADLFAKHAVRGEPFGLEATLLRLGVRRSADGVTFDDATELAWVRRAIGGRP